MSGSTEPTYPASDYAYHRIERKPGAPGVWWYEHAHAECAQALPSNSQIYQPHRAPAVFDVDIYTCELCKKPIGDHPHD